MKKKRNIFSELTEGFSALKLQREGKLDLPVSKVKRNPALTPAVKKPRTSNTTPAT